MSIRRFTTAIVAATLVVGSTFAAIPTARAVPADGSGSAATAEPTFGSIVVHAAGDRDLATGQPVPLEGALIRAYADAGLQSPVGVCTTDGAGACTIPGLALGTYFVAPAGDPPGGTFRRIQAVTTSFGASEPYSEAVEVGEGTPSTRRFAYVRANPVVPARCGLRVALAYDLSGSIADEEAATMKQASLEFVDALAGTPSAIAIASFATAAPAAGNTNLDPTSVATPTGVAAVKRAVEALDRPSGNHRFTNWDAAFRSVAGQSDVVVLFTDGSPTVHDVPASYPPVQTGLDQIDAGVLSANAVKAAGTRVLAIGVGDLDELSPENLAVVSGPTENVDYAVTTFADVRTVFRALADALCPRPDPPIDVPTSWTPELVVVDLVPRFTG